MKIAFVLPMPTTKVVGGYKVVYEYANYLVSHNNQVTIFYNSNRGKNSENLPPYIVYILRNIISKNQPKWFNLSSKVNKVNLYSLKKKYFKNFDVVFATAAETATFVNRLNISKKFYLIQDFEANWSLNKNQLIKTYNYKNMELIVVSKWLKKKVKIYTNKKINYIPNGIDSSIFYNYRKKRNKHSICLLYHLDKRKGWDIAEEVIFRLKKIYPDLEVNLFGAPKRQKWWPKWIKYTQKANEHQVADIMNKSSIFMCTSKKEGFGLTGLESMFCGCTLITTDCGGVREYASPNNAFLCDVDDIEELIAKVKFCFSADSADVIKKKHYNQEITTQFYNLTLSQKKLYSLLNEC